MKKLLDTSFFTYFLLEKRQFKSKLDSVLQNKTWKWIDLPPTAKHIVWKWNFKKKYEPDGSIEKYEIRLIAQNINYFETYASVIRISSICISIALAFISNFLYTVKTSFLNGGIRRRNLHEKPRRCVISSQEFNVYKLLKL